MAVEFQLLGDVQARRDDRTVELGHARQRCVLTALLVDANRPVPLDQLINRTWGERPPQRARAAAYTYLSRLRAALAADPDVAIARQATGYVLRVDPRRVDLHRFQHLTRRARAVTSGTEALTLFERALRLWRGEAFAALDTPWLATVRGDLDRQRRAAELDRNDLALERGQHARMLAVLCAGAARHPLDERLAGQLILALYRSGRQADALTHYDQVRRLLAEELGADPGPALRRLHRQILTADPALVPPGPVIVRSAP